ncbi:hypothetical protein HBI46_235900 [Parastagonospora nodorum]|nr:hypothetical protein HBH43_223550 [Parastagonospora nodorum]KAH5400089.1 hypothetical protein HBI46_235900 [Parastagonospora nodorum]
MLQRNVSLFPKGVFHQSIELESLVSIFLLVGVSGRLVGNGRGKFYTTTPTERLLSISWIVTPERRTSEVDNVLPVTAAKRNRQGVSVNPVASRYSPYQQVSDSTARRGV